MKTVRPALCALIATVLLRICNASSIAQTALPVSSANATGDHSPTRSRSNVTTSPQMPSRSTQQSASCARGPLTESELLSGVTLTDDQKITIDQIHRSMRAKMEIVAKDENETPEQKSAMLEGLHRMQLRQVFDVLKPDQRDQVRKRISALRAAQRQPQPEQKSH